MKIMKNICYVVCGKHRKVKNPTLSNIFEFIVWSKCEKEDEKIFKEEESIEIFKIFGFMKSM